MVVLISLAVIGSILILGALNLSLRNKAVPIEPAPLRDWPSLRLIKDDAAPAGQRTLTIHKVVEGESLSGIADHYGIDIDTIYSANPGIEELIYPGEELVILPQRGAIHIVQAGDTLWAISRDYGVEISEIISANGKTEELLIAGEKLFIPGGRRMRKAVPTPSRGGDLRFHWPAAGELASGFGYRWGRLHNGIDLAAETGAPVTASQGGYVTYAGWWSGYGYTVILDHYHGYTSLYGHLSDYNVVTGEYVSAGARIGKIGSTGYSTGPHLHFEIRYQGAPINPLSVLP
jgi:LysM repeat protein